MEVGDRLGRYRILGPLGAGGMGEVYRARDESLERDVAVKVLPAPFVSDAERLRRFEIEARALSALNHPNILVIHDVGTHEGVPYIVNELLEGESLRARLGAGALPPRKAVEFAEQIASGLAAAHDRGITHRDLKPENVFVTREGRIKILDFGLARPRGREGEADPEATATHANLTRPGTMMGTVGYMSPEQVRGLDVDHRTDIFALGCVLYEMVAGKAAFARSTTADTIAAILGEDPPDPATLGAAIPPALSQAIAHCLEKQPEERFQSARDLAFDLRSVESAVGATPARVRPSRSTRGRAWRWVAAGAVAIALVAAGLFLARFRPRPAAPEGVEARRIVVPIFENRTGDASLDPLGRMASDWITQGLSRIEGIEVVPTTSVLLARPAGGGQGAAGRDPVQALAEETGAGIVVSGAYYRQGGTLQFQARVTDAAQRKLLVALEPVAGPANSPMTVIDALREKVAGAIAVRFFAVHELAATQKPPLYDAYREFIAGFEVFGADDAEALRHFERASEIDPSFPPPRFYAAYLRVDRGQYDEARRILREVGERREELTPLARRWLDAIDAFAAHRFPDALRSMKAVQELAPRDRMVAQWVGFTAMMCNHPRAAVDALSAFKDRAWVGHPLGGDWTSVLCASLHMLGEHERELDEARVAQGLYPNPLRFSAMQVRALAALGRVADVERVLEESSAAASKGILPGDVMLEAAAELRAHGHRAESLSAAKRAPGWFADRRASEPENEAWVSGLLDAERWSEDWDGAEATCRAILAKAPGDAKCLGVLGAIAARRGGRDEAARMSEALHRLGGPYQFGAPAFRRACIAAQLGEKDKALELLRDSFAEGQQYGVLPHREIDLEPLRDDPGWRELLRPKG